MNKMLMNMLQSVMAGMHLSGIYGGELNTAVVLANGADDVRQLDIDLTRSSVD